MTQEEAKILASELEHHRDWQVNDVVHDHQFGWSVTLTHRRNPFHHAFFYSTRAIRKNLQHWSDLADRDLKG